MGDGAAALRSGPNKWTPNEPPIDGCAPEGLHTPKVRESTGVRPISAPVVNSQPDSNGRSPGVVKKEFFTQPSVATSKNGFDNENHDLIVAKGDCIFNEEQNRTYCVQSMLGQGTFGQVFKCSERGSAEVAVKVIKNQQAFYHQARIEIGLLKYLSAQVDCDPTTPIVRMKDFFLFKGHLCLVFELLSVNLYELIRKNQFRGLSLNLLRIILEQILTAMKILHDLCIIHCDLKPENVLLREERHPYIKVIDFGSACVETKTTYMYIQSRFYRSPEVVLGHPYNGAIDMWSLGCMAAELYLGLPLFPGACEHDLLCRITEMFGPLPERILAHGANTDKFFRTTEEVRVCGGRQQIVKKYTLRTIEDFELHNNQRAPVGKRYFKKTDLHGIINEYANPSERADDPPGNEQCCAFADFLRGVLALDPDERWSPKQALQHPFFTGDSFTGPFEPLADPIRSPQEKKWAIQQATNAFKAPSSAETLSSTPTPGRGGQRSVPMSPRDQEHLAAYANIISPTNAPAGSYLGAPIGAPPRHPRVPQAAVLNIPGAIAMAVASQSNSFGSMGSGVQRMSVGNPLGGGSCLTNSYLGGSTSSLGTTPPMLGWAQLSPVSPAGGSLPPSVPGVARPSPSNHSQLFGMTTRAQPMQSYGSYEQFRHNAMQQPHGMMPWQQQQQQQYRQQLHQQQQQQQQPVHPRLQLAQQLQIQQHVPSQIFLQQQQQLAQELSGSTVPYQYAQQVQHTGWNMSPMRDVAMYQRSFSGSVGRGRLSDSVPDARLERGIYGNGAAPAMSDAMYQRVEPQRYSALVRDSSGHESSLLQDALRRESARCSAASRSFGVSVDSMSIGSYPGVPIFGDPGQQRPGPFPDGHYGSLEPTEQRSTGVPARQVPEDAQQSSSVRMWGPDEQRLVAQMPRTPGSMQVAGGQMAVPPDDSRWHGGQGLAAGSGVSRQLNYAAAPGCVPAQLDPVRLENCSLAAAAHMVLQPRGSGTDAATVPPRQTHGRYCSVPEPLDDCDGACPLPDPSEFFPDFDDRDLVDEKESECTTSYGSAEPHLYGSVNMQVRSTSFLGNPRQALQHGDLPQRSRNGSTIDPLMHSPDGSFATSDLRVFPGADPYRDSRRQGTIQNTNLRPQSEYVHRTLDGIVGVGRR